MPALQWKTRRMALCVLLPTTAILCFLMYDKLRPRSALVRVRSHKYILLWNEFFGEQNLGQGPAQSNIFAELGCARSDCFMTDDRSLMAAGEYDAIVFHMFHKSPYRYLVPFRYWINLPRARSANQRYIFLLMEAPPMCGSKYEGLEGVFNWTMTYRADSDIVRPYAEIQALKGTPSPAQGWLPPPAAPIAPAAALALDPPPAREGEFEGGGGRAVVAWLVSNCRTQSRREDLVRALQEHIAVDVYGDCGTPWPKGDHASFYRKLSADYKFYLAFENSLCRDYVTEKFFNALPLDVVPVVYGAANYSAVAPPDSYIDAQDFATPYHLAQYLLFLSRHPEELAKFFWWKDHYRVVRNPASTLCHLCARLHDSVAPRVYQDVAEWWGGPGVCHEPQLAWDES